MAHHFTRVGDWYVSAIGGDDTTGDGTPHKPFKTLAAAITAADGGAVNQTIIIGTGVYNEIMYKADNNEDLYLIGDGNVIFNGAGLLYGTQGSWQLCQMENIQFVNYGTRFYACTNGYAFSLHYKCSFTNIHGWWGNNWTSAYSYEKQFHSCKFVNVSELGTYYVRGGWYTNCHFHDSLITGTNIGYNSNTYHHSYKRCIFTTSTEDSVVLSGRFTHNHASISECGFDAKGRVYLQLQNDVYVNTIVSAKVSPELFKTGSNGFFKNIPAGGRNNYAFSASFNTTSGSYFTVPLRSTLDFNNSDLYRANLNNPLSGPGGESPTLVYGYNASSANPLHPDGGATWVNITSSSLGGFQIDSTGATGSIITSVIDQGFTKPLTAIRIGFESTAFNAAAPSTHPSGTLNHNPTRYQYEMKYGNASDLSSETYKIFEWNQQPLVINGGATGSGDQNFQTGSADSGQLVSARYLQLRITLRNDMSGSA